MAERVPRRPAPAAVDGPASSALLKAGRFFTKWDETADGRAVFRKGGRAGDVFYRDRWSHDKVVRSTHGVNCTGSFLTAAMGHDAWFSVIAQTTPQVVRVIASIEQGAWTPTTCPKAVWDDPIGGWVSDAQVAVKRVQPQASDGSVQGELVEHWRHYAFVTKSTLTTIEADERHRDHAIVERLIAELKDEPRAHLPSGHYAANAAWQSFVESFRGHGQADVAECLCTYPEIGFAGPLRPDHAPTMYGDSNVRPGYSMLERVFATGYIRGLEHAICGHPAATGIRR